LCKRIIRAWGRYLPLQSNNQAGFDPRIAFPVDEELLRRLAATDVPGKPTIWAFRLIAKTGPDYRGGLSRG
jgi:hypothetical protein